MDTLPKTLTVEVTAQDAIDSQAGWPCLFERAIGRALGGEVRLPYAFTGDDGTVHVTNDDVRIYPFDVRIYPLGLITSEPTRYPLSERAERLVRIGTDVIKGKARPELLASLPQRFRLTRAD